MDLQRTSNRNDGALQVNSPYPASQSDWEKQRKNFEQLYSVDDKPLWMVMDEMKQLYGFEATYVSELPINALSGTNSLKGRGSTRER